MRPQLFRLTSETEDNNDELMVILRLTDEVNRIINLCKDKHPDIINMQRWEKLVENLEIQINFRSISDRINDDLKNLINLG